MTKIISSQEFRDWAIVEAKQAAKDYVVTLSLPIEINGEAYRVVIDGHHSLTAAIEDGVTPEYVDADDQTAGEHAYILENEGAEALLNHLYIDSDYHDAVTGERVW